MNYEKVRTFLLCSGATLSCLGVVLGSGVLITAHLRDQARKEGTQNDFIRKLPDAQKQEASQ